MKRMLAAALAGFAAWLAVPATTLQADVKEGQPAPDIKLPATQIGTILPDKKDAKELALKDLRGKKNVVVYFFPKALTKG